MYEVSADTVNIPVQVNGMPTARYFIQSEAVLGSFFFCSTCPEASGFVSFHQGKESINHLQIKAMDLIL